MKAPVAKSKSGAKRLANNSTESVASPDADDRARHIATAAYFKAEARGFSCGKQLDDWLDAEADFYSAISR